MAFRPPHPPKPNPPVACGVSGVVSQHLAGYLLTERSFASVRLADWCYPVALPSRYISLNGVRFLSPSPPMQPGSPFKLLAPSEIPPRLSSGRFTRSFAASVCCSLGGRLSDPWPCGFQVRQSMPKTRGTIGRPQKHATTIFSPRVDFTQTASSFAQLRGNLSLTRCREVL